jgi:Putative peptidoglycan binding domain
MTTRDQIVNVALGYNGNGNGEGYDGPNPFSADLGRPAEAWCGDFVTDIYKRAQIPLPAMQPFCRTGFAYCPDAVLFGQMHSATRYSWQAQPGDIVLFDFNGNQVADHTEIVTAYQGGDLLTIGGNSGPSNIDDFQGQGGVHRHRWSAPAGHGNDQVLTVLDTSKIVLFGAPAYLTSPAKPLEGPRLLMLKSPMMKGADVQAVQQALNSRGQAGLAVDGIYSPPVRDAVVSWQRREHLAVDGIVGPQTRASLGLPAPVSVPA